MKIMTLLSDKYEVEYTINLSLMIMCYMNSSDNMYGLKIVYNTHGTLEDYIILGSLKEHPNLYEECHNLQMIIHDFLSSNETSIVVTDTDFCSKLK